MSNYTFFFSYARRDASGDSLLHKFYEDLANEVAKKRGLPSQLQPHDIAFLDQSGIEVAEEWSEELLNALQNSELLVCLVSPGYCSSNYCMAELKIFEMRVEAYFRQSRKKAPTIVPVLWESPRALPKSMPETLKNKQFTHESYGEIYANEGLRYMMRLTKHSDDYQNFLDKFAFSLIDIAQNHPLPKLVTLPPLQHIINTLYVRTTTQNVSSQPQILEGPGAVRFAYIVGTKEDLAAYRAEFEQYGNESHKWRPYHPIHDTMIGMLCLDVAYAERLHYEVIPTNGDLLQNIQESEEKNTIVVFIVDPWSLKLDLHQKTMIEFDKINYLNCGVVVPWNDQDAETISNEDKLHSKIKTVFRHYVHHTGLFRHPVTSVEAFTRELRSVIDEIRRRLLDQAPPLRPIDTSPYETMPRLIGAK